MFNINNIFLIKKKKLKSPLRLKCCINNEDLVRYLGTAANRFGKYSLQNKSYHLVFGVKFYDWDHQSIENKIYF